MRWLDAITTHLPQLPALPAPLHLLQVPGEQGLQWRRQPGHRREVPQADLRGKTRPSWLAGTGHPHRQTWLEDWPGRGERKPGSRGPALLLRERRPWALVEGGSCVIAGPPRGFWGPVPQGSVPAVVGSRPSPAILWMEAPLSAPPKGSPHLHMVEGDAHFLVEVRAEERDLGIALAEVGQHDEGCAHPHAHADGLGGGAAHMGQREAAGAGRAGPGPGRHLGATGFLRPTQPPQGPSSHLPQCNPGSALWDCPPVRASGGQGPPTWGDTLLP